MENKSNTEDLHKNCLEKGLRKTQYRKKTSFFVSNFVNQLLTGWLIYLNLSLVLTMADGCRSNSVKVSAKSRQPVSEIFRRKLSEKYFQKNLYCAVCINSQTLDYTNNDRLTSCTVSKLSIAAICDNLENLSLIVHVVTEVRKEDNVLT